VHDLGEKIGCGAHLASLRRMSSGRFDVAKAVPFEKLLTRSRKELEPDIIPIFKLTGTE
jgi:tRNA pseudouridine55 synthase